ncbi:MAG: sigma-54 dependent transcriptional regulator [Polyangiaceae bacterium]
MAERILIVEDESTLGQNIARYLGKSGYVVTVVERGDRAIAELDRGGFDLVVSDLRLPDTDGLAVLDHVKRVSPEVPVLIMTAYASVDSAVEALRRGAEDYVLKPLSLADLARKVKNIEERRRLGQENARLRSLASRDGEPITLLRQGGPAMTALVDFIEKVAATNSTVLIRGESGVGKELVARAVHDLSPRRDAPFVSLNVSAIPDTLVESYLFGHERGAFSGADRRREGLFRTASGGTLFLDEIGELPLSIQAKLLRAVETKEVLPVGSDRALTVDTRIVAATHRDLAAMVQTERFRRDLLYRLSVIQIQVPPLRDRDADIPALALTLAHRHAREQRKTISAIEPEALSQLRRYPWPGNVRELANVMERAVLLCQGPVITVADLPLEVQVASTSADAAQPPPSDAREPSGDLNLAHALIEFERSHLTRALNAAKGNREAAAKLLGLSPATLYRTMQRVGLKGFRTGGTDGPPESGSR